MKERVRVGYVGVGLMGHGAAKNILLKGWPLTILGHRNRAPVDDLAARGATEAGSPDELAARSDVIFLCLPGAPQVEALLEGQGLIDSLRPGTIIADSTTSLPDVTRRLGAKLAAKGCGMVDAPIGRTPKEAEEGRLSCLLGGDPVHVAAVRPVVEAFADTVIEAGALGNGLLVKLVNNVVSFSNAVVIAEAFATASRLGVPVEALCAMIEAGGSNSTMFQWISPWIREGDDSRGRGRLAAGTQVHETYRAVANAAGASTPMADAVSSVMREVLAAGHGDRFIPTLPGILAARAGAPIRPLD